jgi:acetyl/propionyl-CoA carboxylase alpha subunit
VRIDAGVETGDEITPHYDAMIAKIIAHGSHRTEALDRLQAALRDTVVAGPRTNLGFLRRLLATRSVRECDLDTALIERERHALLDATDTDTCGNLVVYCHMDANALPVRHEFVVLQANVYDSLIGGTTYLETNPGKFSISSTTLSLKNRAGTEDTTRTITATAGADPITGLS